MKRYYGEFMMKRVALLFALVLIIDAGCLFSQNYHGTVGLLQVPCAESDSAATFRGGFFLLHRAIMPSMGGYNDGQSFNTMCYTVGCSVWSWLELSYTGVLLKMHKGGNIFKNAPMGYYNEDRHLNVKLRPLKEGKWWPAVALGCDDVGRFSRIWTQQGGNNFFQNIYVTVSKHVSIHDYELGIHLSYRYYSSDMNKERRGVVGGLTLRPRFYRPLRTIIEWDGLGVNIGADVLLWRHLFLQAAIVHGRGFTGGIGYHYRIKF